MSTYKIDWFWFPAWGEGYQTIDVNIPPALVGVQVSMHGCADVGASDWERQTLTVPTAYAGIKHFRRRLNSGSDEDHDFGGWDTWPPAIFDFISSVTLATSTGTNQTIYLVARLDYWRGDGIIGDLLSRLRRLF